MWTWSKVVRRVALAAEVPRFSTHTTRHLCLTDLARMGWELHAIATFAGHRSTDSTLRYIHLSGRELSAKLNSSMSQIHAWRVSMLTGPAGCAAGRGSRMTAAGPAAVAVLRADGTAWASGLDDSGWDRRGGLTVREAAALAEIGPAGLRRSRARGTRRSRCMAGPGPAGRAGRSGSGRPSS